MPPPAKSTRKRSADLVSLFRIDDRPVRHLLLGFGELWIGAALGGYMDGSREEGSGRAPNAAISAVRLMLYTGNGESHRSTCCHPDLYAGPQGNPGGGYR
jgi:hypothetical protein